MCWAEWLACTSHRGGPSSVSPHSFPNGDSVEPSGYRGTPALGRPRSNQGGTRRWKRKRAPRRKGGKSSWTLFQSTKYFSFFLGFNIFHICTTGSLCMWTGEPYQLRRKQIEMEITVISRVSINYSCELANHFNLELYGWLPLKKIWINLIFTVLLPHLLHRETVRAWANRLATNFAANEPVVY